MQDLTLGVAIGSSTQIAMFLVMPRVHLELIYFSESSVSSDSSVSHKTAIMLPGNILLRAYYMCNPALWGPPFISAAHLMTISRTYD